VAPVVSEAAAQRPEIEWLGRRSPDDVAPLMGSAALLIFPSEWYEGLSRTIVEAFAAGTPVVSSDLGSMRDLIREGETGLCFVPGSPDGLATAVERAWADPNKLCRMRGEARREFERRYTADANYPMLTANYEDAIAAAGRESPRTQSMVPGR
jgi:glycosyltransferase involved in cell wall biosynthesis